MAYAQPVSDKSNTIRIAVAVVRHCNFLPAIAEIAKSMNLHGIAWWL